MAFHRQLIAQFPSLRFWRVAALAATGVIGAASHADAALYYWREYDPGYYDYRPEPPFQPRRPKVRPPLKKEATEKRTGAKPQAPLMVVVSLNKQQVKIYDANGFFAEAPVSTGMRGHPTPMGVFSVIQKQKWHRSNIYSGAPMPYMQRITWSGIAMHAGVLPGYPASHGCIRMPEAFAIKMWNWTRLGARVLVTPGDLAPESFSHPLLPSLKVQPQSASSAAEGNDAPAVKADKGAPAPIEAKLELRSTVGDTNVTAALSENARTADAGGDVAGSPKAKISPATVAEAGKVGAPGPDGAEPGSPKAGAAGPNEKTGAAAPTGKGEAVGHIAPAGDASKDQTRPPDAAKAAAAAKRAGPIAVFISRKDSKLYVRQNFVPLFDAAVTIAPSDRPLGTHVFTAEVDKKDANVLHWTVASLPARSLRREKERKLPRRKDVHAVAAEAKPLPVADSPAEALDRITVPADVMTRITDALTTGSSIIVSDQGINQGETGEGTDFIVSLR